MGLLLVSNMLAGSAHPPGWARIETAHAVYVGALLKVAPTLRGGRGLKQIRRPNEIVVGRGSAHPPGWARIETY
uniref:Uncharacterized protein n=1 Tax=mine drainage metagenome TaxID=410659 RepID=E6QQF5_9ZZZZ